MTAADLTPEEIAAALAARRELGPEYEDAIAVAWGGIALVNMAHALNRRHRRAEPLSALSALSARRAVAPREQLQQAQLFRSRGVG